MAAICLDRLSKRYGRVEAVRGLTLEVPEGEVFGFLGVNGAGKTTTIRILLDLVRPTAGRAFVFGHDCQRDGRAVRALTGYLPGELGLFPDMTGQQVLDTLAALDLRPPDRARRAALLDRFRLSARDLQRRIREYSTGMKRKLGLVQVFQYDRPLLVLDEPTEGLDPLMQDEFFDLLAEETRQGRTVFMSSHVLSEVERVCHRVGLLREGGLAIDATVEELQAMAPRRVVVTFLTDVNAPPSWPTGISPRLVAGRTWELEAKGPLGDLVRMLSTLPTDDVSVRPARLEDILTEYYRGER